MDKVKLDQLIEIANKQEPLDLTHVEEARFVRDLDVPAVVLLWRSSHGEVRHWFAKYPAGLTIASDGGNGATPLNTELQQIAVLRSDWEERVERQRRHRDRRNDARRARRDGRHQHG